MIQDIEAKIASLELRHDRVYSFPTLRDILKRLELPCSRPQYLEYEKNGTIQDYRDGENRFRHFTGRQVVEIIGGINNREVKKGGGTNG